MSLLHAFLENLPAERAADVDAASDDASRGALEAALASALARARSAWPNVSLDEATWGRVVAERVAPELPLLEAIGALHASDVFLAVACAKGDAPALVHFQRNFEPELRGHLLRTGLDGPDADDTLQTLRGDLFVGDGSAKPKILGFRGKGDLRWWLRAVVTRTGVRRRRAEQKNVTLADSQIEASGDHELAYFRRAYGPVFEEAFRVSWRELEARERVLLRQRLRHQLSLAELAALHGVHESTISRWATEARERLLDKTRTRMMDKLKIGRAEISSMLRLLESVVDLSISVSE